MKDGSDDPSRHERTLLPRNYISLLQSQSYNMQCVCTLYLTPGHDKTDDDDGGGSNPADVEYLYFFIIAVNCMSGESPYCLVADILPTYKIYVNTKNCPHISGACPGKTCLNLTLSQIPLFIRRDKYILLLSGQRAHRFWPSRVNIYYYFLISRIPEILPRRIKYSWESHWFSK